MDLSNAVWRKSSRSSGNGGNCVEVATVWRKSSRSSENGGNCVEVAAVWRKSSRSSENGGMCVEVARLPHLVAVRDSKNRGGPALLLSPEAWRRFTTDIKHDLI